MELVWCLVFYLLLATTASSIAEFLENKPQLNQSGTSLTVYHVASQSSFAFPDVLTQDEARVKSLNSRLTKDIGTSSEHVLGPKSVNIPLNPGLSIGAGNYYVKVGLGTPAKHYAVLVDTGSSFSWLQCQPCEIYCHTQVDPLFDPSASKTYKSLSCATPACSSLREATLNDPSCDPSSHACVYTASYGDASYSVGYLSQDSLTLTPSQTLPAFIYGCGQDNQGLFGKAAGLVGLARHKLSMLAQMSTKYGYAFSYCLPTAGSASASASASAGGGRGGGGGGEGSLSIGQISLVTSPAYKFTPMITDSRDPSLYFLKLTAIDVGGRALGVGADQYRVPTIIDSGTVITRLPLSVYTALRQVFVKMMSSNKYQQAPGYSILDACFKGSLKGMSKVPKVRLIFQGGAELILAAPNVLIDVDKGTTCLAFAGNSATSQIAVIGNYQQQTFKVAYDVSNSRIGFSAGGCH